MAPKRRCINTRFWILWFSLHGSQFSLSSFLICAVPLQFAFSQHTPAVSWFLWRNCLTKSKTTSNQPTSGLHFILMALLVFHFYFVYFYMLLDSNMKQHKDSSSIWKALADPVRRRLMDLIREAPQTTGDLVGLKVCKVP